METLQDYNLHKNEKLSTISFENEEDWLELRTKGIGGSDIGAILGINPYASPLSIYNQKVKGYVKDMSNNPNVKKGKDLEDVILTKYVQPYFAKLGYTVGKPQFMLINSDYPYFRANVDGIAFNPANDFTNNIIVEIKWVGAYSEDSWNKPEYCGVPPSYYAQVQLYMAVTGASSAVICALFDKAWEMHYFVVPKDETFILNMIREGDKFYQYHMLMRLPPRLDYNLDKEDVIEAIKVAPAELTPSPLMTSYIETYLSNGQKLKKAEETQNLIKNKILDLAIHGYCPDDAKHKVKTSVVSTRRFNSTKFKEDHADMYEQYCEDSESTRFTIK